MRIALGSDHHGIESVRTIAQWLRTHGHEPRVLGPTAEGPTDYPDSAWLVARAVSEDEADRGLLVCGSGAGMAMAANKVPGVRAALGCDAHAVEMTRRHNDANVLCLSAERCGADDVVALTEVFLATPFEGGRHERRVRKIEAIERGEDPALCG